jgi:hypothetical protein
VSKGPLHLLVADDLLTEPMSWSRVYLSLCGKVLTDADLAHATCPDEGCECEFRYCQACVEWAAGWNAELDADARHNAGLPRGE